MPADRKHAESIARDLIAHIASEWVDTPDARCVQEDGNQVFVFTLRPIDVVNDGEVVERPTSTSTIHFNPLAEATEIVVDCVLQLESRLINEHMMDDLLLLNARGRIRQMLRGAPDVFADAAWQAQLIGVTVCGLETMRTFGNSDYARALINKALDEVQEKLRERFGAVTPGRNPKINQFSIGKALSTFYQKFSETGDLPSQRQFAKQLDVTPKAWRDFLKKKDLGTHEFRVKRWLEGLRATEAEKEGWILPVRSIVPGE